MILAVLIAFVAGLGCGIWFSHVANPSPQERIRRKAKHDLKLRLGKDGLPLNPSNDYERHLYALKLRWEGKSKAEVATALLTLGLGDVPAPKRLGYIQDILNSFIVGFPKEKLEVANEGNTG